MKKFLFIFALVIFSSFAFSSTEEDSSDATSEESSSLVDQIKEAGESIGSEIQKVVDSASEAINSKSSDTSKTSKSSKKAVKITGTLKVQEDADGNLSFSIEDEDAETWTLKTISKSKDSTLKLSGYKDKKVVIKGIANEETKEITVTSYKLSTN